jgi:AmiR/NasT family two-component response regulator
MRESYDPRVSQASGMVSVQAQCSIAEALQLLRDRALVTGRSVNEIARDTVERHISFGPTI